MLMITAALRSRLGLWLDAAAHAVAAARKLALNGATTTVQLNAKKKIKEGRTRRFQAISSTKNMDKPRSNKSDMFTARWLTQE